MADFGRFIDGVTTGGTVLLTTVVEPTSIRS